MNDTDDIQKLIRLKRYERPEDGYFEEFISEFQRRQRSELLQRSAHGIFCERLATYVSSFGKQPWFIGAGAGAAAALAVMFVYMDRDEDSAMVEIVPQNRAIHENVLWNVNLELPRTPAETAVPTFIDWRPPAGELIPAIELGRDF